MAAVAKTFKIEPETISKLQEISDGLGMTWDETFAELAGHYQQSQAAQAQGREAEVRHFRALLNQVCDAYTASLDLYGRVQETTRQEFSARLESAEQSVSSLKESAAKAREDAQNARSELAACQHEKEALEDSLRQTQEALDAETAAGATEASKHASEVSELRQLKGMLTEENEDLRKKIDGMEAEIAAATALEEAAKTANENAVKEKARADAAEAEFAKLTKELEDERQKSKDAIQQQKGRYDEKMDALTKKLTNEKETAVLNERRSVEEHFRSMVDSQDAKYQKRIDKMQVVIDKITKQRDEWQAKFYDLRDASKEEKRDGDE